MRSLEEQLARVLDAAQPLSPVRQRLVGALGHYLAEDIHSPIDLPSFDNSAMDGYAVRLKGTAVDAPLRVVADVPAGAAIDPPLAPGECARIMTGAPVPTDADAIVPLEDTTLGTAITAELPDAIQPTRTPAMGAHIRRRGEDVRAGEVIARAGSKLGARQLSALAASGVAEVLLYPRPRVAIISTGDELAEPGAPLERGQLYDSNRVLLQGLLAEAGVEVVEVLRANDSGQGFLAALDQAAAAGSDVIITTGGVSVGAFDVVRLELERSDWQIEFTKVAMQPGKPQGFGVAPTGALMFALPGNPVSVFVSFAAFVAPALARLAGSRAPAHDEVVAIAGESWSTSRGRAQLMPVRWLDSQRVVPATSGGSRSHLVARLAAAEGLAFIPAETERVEIGDQITVWRILD